MVVHPKGITLAKNVGDSFAIIHAKGAEGATVGAGGIKIDRFGNAIVNYLSPYEENSVTIDPDNLPFNVELSSTKQEVIPKADSAILLDFKAKQNAMVLFDVTLANGGIPPMAAEAFDEQGKMIGYVVQGGRLFAGDLQKTAGKIKIVWGGGKADRCVFDYHIPNLNRTNSQAVNTYAVQCQAQ
ncbi:fimbria/pilus outer membrane usher protein [Moraxella sp. ZY200743]